MAKDEIKVLVVEDERIVAEDIKARLESLAYSVTGISFSGEDAVKKSENMRPDLVLMDIVLQGEMDGIEAASIISSSLDIPIIYLTAYADDRMLERAKITEPFGYILKPFEDRELLITIEMALYKHKMRKVLKESERRYRGVVENAHDAIYISTANGLHYANPAFEKLTGYGKEDLCSSQFDFWKIVHPQDVKAVKERKEARKRGEEESISYQFRIVNKDGGVRVVDANTVILSENGLVKEIGILRDITYRIQAEQERKQSSERLRRAMEETVNALASAVEMRDPYTAGHQKRVTNLACAIAREMGLSKEKIEGIQLAGLLHDVGKIFVPGEILSMPGKLSEIAFNLVKTHPQVGHDILKEIEFPYPVATFVLQHHERMDGSGYPSGLSGNQILLEARILAVADVVEAMSSHRPYRPVLGINKAIQEIKQNRGILYDAQVVDACLRILARNGLNSLK